MRERGLELQLRNWNVGASKLSTGLRPYVVLSSAGPQRIVSFLNRLFLKAFSSTPKTAREWLFRLVLLGYPPLILFQVFEVHNYEKQQLVE